MKKIETTSAAAQSADLMAENIAQFKVLFPELLTESANGVAINVEVLKQLVGDATVTEAEEKYGLNWHGKRRARQLALTPSTGTLRPCVDDSVDWDATCVFRDSAFAEDVAKTNLAAILEQHGIGNLRSL